MPFKWIPPTALIVDDYQILTAIVHHLARLGVSAPQHVSLACTDSSTAFEWYRPAVTHITWKKSAVVNRIVNWANQMSHGKNDRRLTHIRATLLLGGTIGPVPQA